MSNKHDLPPLAYMRAEGNSFNGYAACHAQDHRAFPVVRLDDALAAIQRLEAENAKAREIIDQLCACHDEPECPAVAVAREWLADAAMTKEHP